jgi:hypothetical protein
MDLGQCYSSFCSDSANYQVDRMHRGRNSKPGETEASPTRHFAPSDTTVTAVASSSETTKKSPAKKAKHPTCEVVESDRMQGMQWRQSRKRRRRRLQTLARPPRATSCIMVDLDSF